MAAAIAERKAPTAVDQVRHDLEGSFRQQLQMVLPEHVSIEKFCRVAMTAMQGNYLLAKCDRRSFLKACLEAATDGLLPDGREGAIVPFKNNKAGIVEAQWQPMVWGLVKLVRNSGELLDIGSYIVRETDVFEQWVDEAGPHFKHTPNYLMQGKPIAVYAYARTKDGGFYIEVMSWKEIERFKSLSKAKSEDSPWNTWPEEMAKVRPIKRLAKRLPMSTDVAEVFSRDDKREGIGTERFDPVAHMNRQIVGSPAPALENDASPVLEQDLPAESAVAEKVAPKPSAAPGEHALSYASVRAAIEKSPDPDTLDVAGDLIGSVTDEGQRKELSALFNARREALQA